MWQKMINFFSANWIDLLLVFVGALALVIYILQERRKVSEAASLIILQVNDLQKRMREMQTYIVDRVLNDTAFYESQILFTEDYWGKFKHFFVKKIDATSCELFDCFYNCASEILEQQQLMKNLQKNSFFLTQQTLSQLESCYIQQGLTTCAQYPVEVEQLIKGLENTIPQNIESTQKIAVENMLRQIGGLNSNVNFNAFWSAYNQYRANVRVVINQKGLTPYIPEQIRLSLEKALGQYASIHIIECEGYEKIKKIAERKL